MAPLFQRLFTVEEEDERPKAAPETLDAPPAETVSGEQTRPIAQATAPTELRESPGGLIPAGNLPPAADALAELFADSPADYKASERDGASGQRTEERAASAAPKRRNLFARLLTFKRPPKTTPEKQFPIDQNPAEAVQTEGRAEIVTETACEAAAPAPADFAVPATTPEPVIAAEELPSAADDFEKLFPSEQSSPQAADAPPASPEQVQPEAGDEVPAEAWSEVGVDALVEVLSHVSTESTLAQSVEEWAAAHGPSRTDPEPVLSADTVASVSANEGLVDTVSEKQENAGRLGANDSQWPYESPYPTPADTMNPELASDVQTEVRETDSHAELTEALEVPAETDALAPEAPRRAYKDWAFDEKLASHREWVESHGRSGQRADLSGAELEASDLISVNLRLADLHDANLRASDLLLADLRDACLVRADLEEACLVGANLEGANLEGASLETSMGLVPRQFAGANLRDALLPPQLMEFEVVGAFQSASQNAFRYFAAMTVASVVSWLVIWKTRDTQFLTDSAVFPFLHSHVAAAALPTAESYLIVPVALFILYLLFHFHLQRLWDSVMELPAIFPDGHSLGDRGPGMISGLLRTHFRWMNPDPSSTRLVEKGVSLLAAYWIVPATLLLFWARDLTRQEIHGTILQALLAVIATGIAAYASTKVGRPQERWSLEKKWMHQLVARIQAINPISVATALGVVLLLLSAGTIAGVPHDRTRAPQYGPANIRRWAANVFWWMAFDPYADLTEASISHRPANWSGADDQVAYVDGLRSTNAKFRYAQAYGVFLANSHLWRADFQGAFLSEADLRGADLGQSNMRFAVMDHTQMNHTNLDRSNLDGADLRRADLRYANLSYCSLADANLEDAQMEGASVYTARLPGATMTRANLEKADFRESYLGGAHMDHADLRSAYLWSAKLPGADLGGAQLETAILIDADLRGANLGGAQLTGTVVNGADLSGTSLEGANLQGALGLSAAQVCSARSRRGVVLDPDMETQVEAQCGK
ncbi:MAG TPA: pentapeptide repeat-containing protein [Candidatus Cybelea sp.]|jgi:uncharacterized protein YjbI with pentapeptide repeats|nr:pentapeptide repeat-containing protein [Candidatus Cybelea sp.]